MLLKLLLFTDTNHMHTQKLSVTAVAPVVNTAPTVSTVSHDVVVSSVVREAEHLVTTETKAEKQGRLGATTAPTSTPIFSLRLFLPHLHFRLFILNNSNCPNRIMAQHHGNHSVIILKECQRLG